VVIGNQIRVLDTCLDLIVVGVIAREIPVHVIFLALNTQKAFDSGPGLIQIVLRLLIEGGCEITAKNQCHAYQQERENGRVDNGQREPQTARDVLLLGQKASR
jgi:hypothetical protein